MKTALYTTCVLFIYLVSFTKVSAQSIDSVRVNPSGSCSGTTTSATVYAGGSNTSLYKVILSNKNGNFGNGSSKLADSLAITPGTAVYNFDLPRLLKAGVKYRIRFVRLSGGSKSTSNRFSIQEQKISASTVSSAATCSGEQVSVDVVNDCPHPQGVLYKVLLSNEAGNFKNDSQVLDAGIVMGKQTNESVAFSLPYKLKGSSKYKIRFASLEGPSVKHTTNMLTVSQTKVISANILSSVVCSGDSISFSVDAQCPDPDGVLYSIKLSSKGGSFAQDKYTLLIGSINLGQATTQNITLSLPDLLASGSKYKLRFETVEGPNHRFTSSQFSLSGTQPVSIATDLATYCSGSNISVTTNFSCPSAVTIPYRVLLSARGGSFASDDVVVLDDSISLGTQSSYTMSYNLPAKTKGGSKYKIRFISLAGPQTSLTSSTFKIFGSANLGEDLFVCDSNSIKLRGSNSADSWLWNTGATTKNINVTPGTYILTQTTSTGCVSSDTIEVISISSPNMAIIPPAAVCPGEQTDVTL